MKNTQETTGQDPSLEENKKQIEEMSSDSSDDQSDDSFFEKLNE